MALPPSASEATLVSHGSLVYTLTNDNPSNTELLDLSLGSSKVSYTVVTEFPGSKTFTFVKNAQGIVIASLEWRDTLSDKVTLVGKQPTSLNTWLKRGFFPLSPVSFHDDQGRKYQWRNVAAGLNMQLHAVDTRDGPIAVFCRSRSNYAKNTFSPATLTLSPRALEIADLCVISFFFLEKNRRMRENTSQSRADVIGTPFSPTRVFVYNGGV